VTRQPNNYRDDDARAVAARDAGLVDRIRCDELGAFEELFHAYWDALCRYAFAYVRSTDDAEEAVQIVFARIWRNRATWRVGGTVQDYVYLATRNACLDRLKRESVARQWGERRVLELRTSPEHGVQTDSLIQHAEVEAAVERAFAELPAKRRRICQLRLSSGMSYSEIASLLGISQKTVETQISRGLKFLRTRLEALRS
jgi:RNA polymerase sigma-70 factor (ECF subfamily)